MTYAAQQHGVRHRVGAVGRRAACLLLLASMWGTSVAAAMTAIEGHWAGERMQLITSGEGATVRSDCAQGRIAGPLHIDAAGRFDWTGSYEQFRPGPQRVEEPQAASATAAYYRGKLVKGVLRLEIRSADNHLIWKGQLNRDAPVKLVRCL